MIDCDVSSLVARAAALEAAGQHAAARAAYAFAAERDPRSCELAAFLGRAGCRDESRREWARVLRAAQSAGDGAREVLACRHLAQLAREVGDFTAADSWQQRAFSVLFDAGAPTVSPLDLIARASDWLIAGNLAAAERLLCRVIEVASAAGDAEAEGDAWGTLGLVQGRGGQLATAARSLRRAVAIHRRHGDQQGVSADYLNLAEVFRVAGRIAPAMTCAKRAVGAAMRSRDPHRWSTAALRAQELERIAEVATRHPEWN